MRSAQIYCTEAELIGDLNLSGNAQLFSRIQAASRFISRRFGQFIPLVETRTFRCNGSTLFVAPLLSIVTAKNDSQAVTDYTLYPQNRYWANGPYTRLEAESFVWRDVEITGKWGLYDEAQELGINVTQASLAASLSISDGSLLSPGMILSIEAEQELVTGIGAASAATSLLAGAVDAGQEELIVDNGAEFHEREVIQLSTEDCFIRMVRGNTLVVARGWNGTTKQSHSENDAISVYRTFTVTRGVNGTTPVAHDDKPLSRQVVPEDVNWLCRQIAGLMHKKAQSGFAGKVGNAELGETFYFNEFPSQIKEIHRNYRIVQL